VSCALLRCVALKGRGSLQGGIPTFETENTTLTDLMDREDLMDSPPSDILLLSRKVFTG